MWFVYFVRVIAWIALHVTPMKVPRLVMDDEEVGLNTPNTDLDRMGR